MATKKVSGRQSSQRRYFVAINSNMSGKFVKKVEDFVCDNCGKETKGGGYTNHCPFCLWSKHVDINPGDREAKCGGMMKPIEVEIKGMEYSIIHQCIKCGHKKKNKTAPDDNFDEVIKISKRIPSA